jgi:RNA polymerase sigma-54 factor
MFQGHYTITSINTQLTAHLAQTMTLLNMNTEELLEKIESELANNPALAIETDRRCPSCGRKLTGSEICPVCSLKKTSEDSDTVVFLSPLKEFSSDYSAPRISNDGEELDFEDYQAGELSLNDYVLQQIRAECSEREYSIAEHLVSGLDEKGFLTTSLFDIARYFHATIEAVESVKARLQVCDPLGICSLNSIEAMQIQVHNLPNEAEVPELVLMIIDHFMDELMHRQFNEIILNTDATLDEITEAMEFIAANLNPFPANAVRGNIRTPIKDVDETYYRPDAVVHFINNDPEKGMSVEVVMPYVNRLYVNPAFKQAINDAPEAQKEKWEQDYNRASLLVKCLQQRAVTLVRLMQYIVDYQKEYILKGEKYLLPLTRAKVSTILDVHESTISRAVAKKTMQLPDGRIIPLSTFFSRNMSVRCVLKEIIAEEDQPLSDSKLVLALKKHGYIVARRTVAKYRMMEGILPAHLRKTVSDDGRQPAGLAIHSSVE